MIPLTVLLIDDESGIRRAFSRILETAHGWRVIAVADPVSARAHYAHVDVVISDWRMPLGGGEVVLLESPRPVIIHSGTYAGLHPYVVPKPARHGQLYETVMRALNEQEATHAALGG